MKNVLLLLALVSPGFAAHYTCTAAASGNLSTITWNNCNGTVPNNGGGHTYSIVANNQQVVIDIDVTVGRSPSGWDATFNNTTDTVSCGACAFVNGDRVRLTPRSIFDDLTAGTQWPLGLGVSDYYVINASGGSFQLSATAGGSAILFTANGAAGIKITGADPAIQILGTGSVTVGEGVHLIQRGDFRMGSPTSPARQVFILSAGSHYTIDSSEATNPDKTSYCAFTPSAALAVGASMRANGTAAKPVYWDSSSDNGALPGGKCYHSLNSTYAGDFFGTYVNITNVGGTVINTLWAYTGVSSFSLSDSTVDGSGPIVDIKSTVTSATATVLLQRNTFKNTPPSHGYMNVSINFGNALTSGTRLIADNALDGMFGRIVSPGLPSVRDVTFRNNFFGRSPRIGCSAEWAEFKVGVVLSESGPTSGFFSLCGPASDLYFMSTVGGNFRGLSMTSKAGFTNTYSRIFCQSALEFNTTDGDCWGGAATPTNKVKLEEYISLPGQQDGVRMNSGIFGTGGLSLARIEIENQTEMGGIGPSGKANQGGGNSSIALSEAAAGSANALASFKGVLKWDIPGRLIATRHLTGSNEQMVLNTATPENLDYNACFNCGLSTRWGQFDDNGAPPWSNSGSFVLTNWNTYYDVPLSGTVPGTHDLNGVDPKFVDDTRNLEKWAEKFYGKDPTIAGIRQVFLEAGKSDFGKMILEAQGWIRQGFAPREIRYAVPDAPRGRIGAVNPVLMFGTINQ